jgi:hypothetical protein
VRLFKQDQKHIHGKPFLLVTRAIFFLAFAPRLGIFLQKEGKKKKKKKKKKKSSAPSASESMLDDFHKHTSKVKQTHSSTRRNFEIASKFNAPMHSFRRPEGVGP